MNPHQAYIDTLYVITCTVLVSHRRTIFAYLDKRKRKTNLGLGYLCVRGHPKKYHIGFYLLSVYLLVTILAPSWIQWENPGKPLCTHRSLGTIPSWFRPCALWLVNRDCVSSLHLENRDKFYLCFLDVTCTCSLPRFLLPQNAKLIFTLTTTSNTLP